MPTRDQERGAPRDLTSLLDELVRRWKEQEAEPRPGNSKDAIRAFEQREGVTLPDDLARYFETVDGMGHMDEEMFCFWPLEKVERAKAEPHGYEADPVGYFLFADFMLYAHAYAVRLHGGAPGEVAALYGKPTPVASSFTEFLEKYLRDPDSVL